MKDFNKKKIKIKKERNNINNEWSSAFKFLFRSGGIIISTETYCRNTKETDLKEKKMFRTIKSCFWHFDSIKKEGKKASILRKNLTLTQLHSFIKKMRILDKFEKQRLVIAIDFYEEWVITITPYPYAVFIHVYSLIEWRRNVN